MSGWRPDGNGPARLTRRGLLGAGVALASGAAGLASAAAQTPAAKFGKVQIAKDGHSMLWAVVYLAADKGFFQEVGVDYDEIMETGAQNALNSVINRDVPFAMGALNEVIIANSKNQQLRAFALLNVGLPAAIVFRKDLAEASGATPQAPLAGRLRALKGRTIAVTTAGTSLDIVLRQMLRSADLDPDRDLTIVYSGGAANTQAALQSGRVEAALTGSPIQELVIGSGKWVKWIDVLGGDYPPLKGLPFSVLFARADTLAGNPALAQALVAAIAKAEAYIQQDKEGARAILRRRFMAMDEAIFNAAFETSYPSFPKTPAVTAQGYAIAHDLLVNSRPDQPKVDVPFAQAVEMRYAAAAGSGN